MVIVQAKRHSSRSVGIETIKALWADVIEQPGSRGLIATTSALAPGAKRYCEARAYRLTAAEGDTVKQWLCSLARPVELSF
jgi:restriction endonuclease Mrr